MKTAKLVIEFTYEEDLETHAIENAVDNTIFNIDDVVGIITWQPYWEFEEEE